MSLPHLKYLPIIETAIALLLVWLPLSNSTVLINGIQTAKSFNFFYGMFALVAVAAIGFLFRKGKLKLNITLIDVLLLTFVVWLTVNKYILHGVHALSLRYFELLGLMALYIILRTLKTNYALYLLLAICISGAVQAVYGNLQLWGHYPSHHGLFKMTGSFFNPGPYAGYLCAVLPVAVGLYWMFNHEGYKENKDKGHEEQIKSIKFQLSGINIKTLFTNLKPLLLNPQSLIVNLKSLINNLQPVIIKYLSLITLITILLVLPAARSRAAWLGAIAGVAYLAWQKYSVGIRLIAYLKGRTKSPLGDLGVVLIPLLFILVASFSLYHYKKDSADGRMLIWTVTANIIKDNPLLGVGQDMFKAHYMDYQADYFRNNPNSNYTFVADDNQYAFNEPLNIWAENGLLGLLLAGGLVLAVFFSPLKNFRFQVSSSKLTEQSNSRFSSADFASSIQVSSFRLTQPETWNLNRRSTERSEVKPETECSVVKPETILKASILAILVFGLFAYPSEILPIKMTGIICLGLLSNLDLTNLKPVTWNLNRNEVEIGVAKLALVGLIFLLSVGAFTQTNKFKQAYTTWKDAKDLYQYGLYEQCLEDYDKVFPLLKYNGEFLINFGKALSIAEKYPKALVILKRAKVYQGNTVLYTALGESHKALREYESAEQCYYQATNMAPGKFYPLYLLAKLYNETAKQQKALEMANIILSKEVKVYSTAIEEIKEKMQQIIDKYAVEQAQNKNSSGIYYRQKGRDIHTSSLKFTMVILPETRLLTTLPHMLGGNTERR